MKSVVKFFIIMVLSTFIVVADESPLNIIKMKDHELQKAIQTYNKTPTDENKKIIISLINGVFDFRLMGQKALPTTVWDNASVEQRKSFITQFTRMIENASFSKLEMYQADSASYNLQDSSMNKANVIAHIWLNGKENIIIYKMSSIDGHWKAWDLLIGDMSTVRTYREQFVEILKTKSLTNLIDILQKKADSYVDPIK